MSREALAAFVSYWLKVTGSIKFGHVWPQFLHKVHTKVFAALRQFRTYNTADIKEEEKTKLTFIS